MATKLHSNPTKTRQKKTSHSFLRAFGLLKKKHINALGYQKKKRAEWSR